MGLAWTGGFNLVGGIDFGMLELGFLVGWFWICVGRRFSGGVGWFVWVYLDEVVAWWFVGGFWQLALGASCGLVQYSSLGVWGMMWLLVVWVGF